MAKTCPSCGTEQSMQGVEECEQCQAPLGALDAPQAKEAIQEKIISGQVSELGPRDAITVGVGEKVGAAVKAMRGVRHGAVLVVDGAKLVGILTERDLLMKVAGNPAPLDVPVRDVMHPDPETLEEGDPIAVAFHKMAVGGYRHLPIRRSGGSLGMVSVRDLMRYLSK